MSKTTKRLVAIVMGFMFIFALAACNSDKGASTNKDKNKDNNEVEENIEEPPEEVTLNFVYPESWEEKRFNEDIKEPIEKQFPHITLNYVADDIEDLLTKKIMPDIIFVGNPSTLTYYKEYEILMDMSELIEKHGFDLDKIEPSLVAESRLFADGNLYTLPYTRGATVMHYNKDIFDLFGVDYPTDDMTWNEVIELAKQVTGERDGQQFYGLQTPYASIMLDQRGILMVDPETDVPTYTSDEYMPLFHEYLSKMERIYAIPGNEQQAEDDDRDPSIGPFFGDRNVAMNPIWSQVETFSEDEDFNFDIVTYPVWEERPGISRPSRSGNVGVAASSEHPDEAFKVVAHLFSDEMQIATARKGRASVLVDPSINEQYLGELIEERPWMEELNLAALTKHAFPTDVTHYSDFEENAYAPLETKLLEGIDINTILREAQEHAETGVLEAKEQK